MDIPFKTLKDFSLAQGKDFLFITLSGAHIYGFPSPDSDFDLRGAHLGALKEVFSLKKIKKTYEVSVIYESKEMDLVSHEVGKYFSLMAKGNNGYVMEQIFSPLVIFERGEFQLLKRIASGFICKLLYHHYRGFAGNQLKLIKKKENPSAKSFLYLYRVLMTGIDVLKTGVIETDIRELNKKFQFDFLPELISKKKKEKSTLSPEEVSFYMDKVDSLEKELDKSLEKSKLPESPGEDSGAFGELEDLLFELRMKSFEK